MKRSRFSALLCAAGVIGLSNGVHAQAPAQIAENDYVQLEVTLTLSTTTKTLTFNTFCPKQSLWGIDLKSLLGGAKHIVLGVNISGPNIAPMTFTPLTIDKKSSGPLGLNKSCDVSIDQIRYLSPLAYVRSHKDEPFNIAPSYSETTTVNPGVIDTIEAVLTETAKLAKIPSETAKPINDGLAKQLGQIAVNHKETLAKHLVITPGPVPADSDNQWRTTGLFSDGKNVTPVDVILTARLIVKPTMIPDPAAGAGGLVRWSTSDVLTTPLDLGGSNPGGTIGSYVESRIPEIATFRTAPTIGEAFNACETVRRRVREVVGGMSDRDEGLLMWALTHDSGPHAPVTQFQVDNLHCLQDAWRFVPAEVLATRVLAEPPPPLPPTPPAPPTSPPTTKQMKQTTQIDDAFALFFKTANWPERRKFGDILFGYPLTYTDVKSALFDSSASVMNVDQWLAYHTAPVPVAARIGCYTYIPASGDAGSSVMYAIADTNGTGKLAQVLVIATFANVAANGDAKIQALEVLDTITEAQRKQIRDANGTVCASGYAPALAFGN